MPLLFRYAVLVVVALALLVPAGVPASAQETIVPPPGPNQNNATLNVLDAINALRKRGYGREADQVHKLLKAVRVKYWEKISDKKAQFRPDQYFKKDDRLILGPEYVKYGKDGRFQRFSNSDDDRVLLAKFAKSLLHEMVHNDQGKQAIGTSEDISKLAKFVFHELEAYRVSLKKYAKAWVVKDVKDYLKNRKSLTDKQRYRAIMALRINLFPLAEDVVNLKPGVVRTEPYGDRACRWQTIRKVVTKLRDDLDALWHDYGSRLACRGILRRGDRYKKIAQKTKLQSDGLRNKIRLMKIRIGDLKRKIRTRKEARDAALRNLTPAQTKSRRLQLASEIGKHATALRVLGKQRAAAKRERNRQKKQLKTIDAKYAASLKKYQKAPANYNQCRVAYATRYMLRDKLKASQLPPDMKKTTGGRLIIVGKKRKIALRKNINDINKLFGYSSKILSATEIRLSKDPRTPCYKPPKAKKIAQKKVVLKKPAAPKIPIATKKPTTKPKKRCVRGGLSGGVNCLVIKPIEDAD